MVSVVWVERGWVLRWVRQEFPRGKLAPASLRLGIGLVGLVGLVAVETQP